MQFTRLHSNAPAPSTRVHSTNHMLRTCVPHGTRHVTSARMFNATGQNVPPASLRLLVPLLPSPCRPNNKKHAPRSAAGDFAYSFPPAPSSSSIDPQASTSTSLTTPLRNPAPKRMTSEDVVAFIAGLPWRRAAIWGAAVFAGYQLSDFFSITMGTFIIAFIGHSFVGAAQQAAAMRQLLPTPDHRRRVLVLTYFALIASVLILFGVMTIPDLVREGADFVQRLQAENIWTVVLEKMRAGLGDGIMNKLERFLLMAGSEDITESAITGMLSTLSPAEKSAQIGHALHNLVSEYVTSAVNMTSGLLQKMTKIVLQVFVSLVLSFMVLWDLPLITAGVRTLKTSRLAVFYEEMAPSIVVFAQLFGKALQAQSRIALVNTGLTALGMWALALPGLGLLSLFVFLCSFIPIAGTFISTAPIAFVALTEYGFTRLALVILMVAFVHFVEAYALNPAIYAAHLKLHPLMVLTVLVVAEHSLGIWGLLLAVPMTVFALDYLIRYPGASVTDVAAKELMTVSDMGGGEDGRDGRG